MVTSAQAPNSILDRIVGGLSLACFFVCPLLFFTDLTRNPYITQSILLYVAILGVVAACALKRIGGADWVLPATPLDESLVIWLAVCALSWWWAYTHHAAFFKGSIRAEGLRVMAFTVVGTIAPFYMGALCARKNGLQDSGSGPLKGLTVFFVVWGSLWILFPGFRATASALSLDGHLWDPYGGLLWIGGFCVLFYLARNGSIHDYWQVALGVAFLSAIYGMCQYFNVEWIWPKSLNPYGGRSVSTFGNPNFMSSYMVVFLPIAVLYYLKAQTSYSRFIYATVCLAMEGSLLASLTRSSWLGAALGVGVLFLSKPVREFSRKNVGSHKIVLGISILMAFLWPHTAVQGSTPTVLGRVSELSSIFNVGKGEVYSPFYQRVLMWACAWTMGKENPLLGKGWGLFDMFYPFYQGPLLEHFEVFRTLRTHGNNAHNELLEIWAQAGILGVGVSLWIWTTFFVAVKRWVKSGAGSEWVLAVAGGVAGMLADNMLNVSLHFPIPAFVFWWQAGTAMGLVRPANGDYRRWRFPVANRSLSLVCVMAVLLSCCGTGWWWVCQWNREVRYFMGFKLFYSGRLSAAVEMLESAYRWHSHEVNTDYELGNAYARTGRFEQSVWAYHEALNSNAGYDEIYYNAAAVLSLHLNRPNEALPYFQTAHWINPLWVDVYTGLATLYMKDPERYGIAAVSLLEEAVRLFPDNAAFLAYLGSLYFSGHEEGKALDMWTRALRINPELSSVEQNLRALLVKEGKTREPVLKDLELYHRLVGEIARKDYSLHTLEDARKAADAFPQCPKPRFFLGSLEMLNGHPEESLRWLEPLTRQDSKNPSLYQNLGEIYLRIGRREDAITAFRAVLGLDPGNRTARERLSQLSER